MRNRTKTFKFRKFENNVCVFVWDDVHNVVLSYLKRTSRRTYFLANSNNLPYHNLIKKIQVYDTNKQYISK